MQVDRVPDTLRLLLPSKLNSGEVKVEKGGVVGSLGWGWG